MLNPGEVVAAHTFGSVLRGLDLDGLSVEEVLMPAGLSVPEHGHEGAQMYFVLEGDYTETVEGQPHLLHPGSFWFRPRRKPHANAVSGQEAALTLILTIENERFLSVERRCSQPRQLRSLLLDEVRSEIVRELQRGDQAAALAVEGWTLLLLSRTERLLHDQAPAGPQWLADAVSFIEHSYLEPLSLATVAAHTSVHPATLAAAFRRFHGISVGELIRNLRLRYAREELASSRRAIKEIALEAGFYDQAHFGRHFKLRYGMSPAALRASGLS